MARRASPPSKRAQQISPTFSKKVEEALPAEVREALLPLVRLAEELSDRIKVYDKRIEQLGREKYEDTELLRQVTGVGPLTSLAYVLTLENPDRFRKSRDVVPFPPRRWHAVCQQKALAHIDAAAPPARGVSKRSAETPLAHTPDGYHWDRVVMVGLDLRDQEKKI